MAVVGINTFLWTTDWTEHGGASAVLDTVENIGFDAVQIPILSVDSLEPAWLSREISDRGLTCCISAGLKPETDVTSEDPGTRRRGTDYLKRCVEIAEAMGCSFLSGSFHSVFGMKLDEPVGEQRWLRSAECLKEVAAEAGRRGMDLALEPINRYESFLVNTASQAEKLIGLIAEPNVKIQLDTFHMNLEEEDPAETIRTFGDRLIHFHVAENHRGRFGRGTVPWDAIFASLVSIGYTGAVVIESFVPDVAEVATAACIWRRMAPSADALASEGLEFLKGLAEKHGL